MLQLDPSSVGLWSDQGAALLPFNINPTFNLGDRGSLPTLRPSRRWPITRKVNLLGLLGRFSILIANLRSTAIHHHTQVGKNRLGCQRTFYESHGGFSYFPPIALCKNKYKTKIRKLSCMRPIAYIYIKCCSPTYTVIIFKALKSVESISLPIEQIFTNTLKSYVVYIHVCWLAVFYLLYLYHDIVLRMKTKSSEPNYIFRYFLLRDIQFQFKT